VLNARPTGSDNPDAKMLPPCPVVLNLRILPWGSPLAAKRSPVVLNASPNGLTPLGLLTDLKVLCMPVEVNSRILPLWNGGEDGPVSLTYRSIDVASSENESVKT